MLHRRGRGRLEARVEEESTRSDWTTCGIASPTARRRPAVPRSLQSCTSRTTTAGAGVRSARRRLVRLCLAGLGLAARRFGHSGALARRARARRVLSGPWRCAGLASPTRGCSPPMAIILRAEPHRRRQQRHEQSRGDQRANRHRAGRSTRCLRAWCLVHRALRWNLRWFYLGFYLGFRRRYARATSGATSTEGGGGGAGASTSIPLAAQKSSRFFRLVATKG